MNFKTIQIITFSIIALFISSCAHKEGPDALIADLDSKSLEQLKEIKSELESGKKEYVQAIRKVKERVKLLQKDEKKRKPVTVGPVVKKDFAHYLTVHGVAEATNNILINPEVGGSIKVIHVKEGQKVSKGQKLVTIDNSTVLNTIDELKSQLEFATIMYNKQKSLHDQNIGTEVQYLQAKNRKESIENSLKTLRSQLNKFIIRAPVSGTVDEIFPKRGELAAPQMPVVRVVNLDKVFIDADVTESLLGKINTGDEVDLTFDGIGLNSKGKIVQVGQFINPHNRTFKIRVDLIEKNNTAIKPNMLSEIRLKDYFHPDAIVVPSKIILQDYDGDFVFVNDHGIAAKKRVKPGKKFKSETEILEGLDGTESLIYDGFRKLTEGEEIEVRTK